MLESSPVLVACSGSQDREKIAAEILKWGLRFVHSSTIRGARALLARQEFSVVFCSGLLPDGDFRAVPELIADGALDVPVIVPSRFDDWASYLDAIRGGAFDYIACLPDSTETERILRMALDNSSAGNRVAQPAA